MLYNRQLQYQQSEQLLECEDCVRKLLCVWSPHTGLLGLAGDEKGGERDKEERNRNRNREKERGGQGDDHAVDLEGDVNSGNSSGTNSSLNVLRTYVTDMLVRTYVTDAVPVPITVLHPHNFNAVH